MSKVLYIILISLFSLTIISCAKKSSDDSSSSTTSTATEDDTTTTTTTTRDDSETKKEYENYVKNFIHLFPSPVMRGNKLEKSHIHILETETLSRESRVTESAQEIVDSTPYNCLV